MRNFKHHKQRSNGFTMVPNEIFMDRRLDDKTLGVLCRLLSLPEDWNFSITGLTKITNSGRDSVRVSLNKLEELGRGELEPTIPCDYYYDWMNE